MQEFNTNSQKSVDSSAPAPQAPKLNVRLICIVLAAVIVLGAVIGLIIGLSGDDTPDVTTKKPQTVVTDWDSLDFSDVSLKVAYNEVINSSIQATGAENSWKYLRGPDDEVELARADYKAAYERHETVCDALDLTLGENFEYVNTGWDGNCDSILAKIQSYNGAGKDAPNIIIHQNYGMVRAGITGEFYNAMTTEYENYFNFSDEHWYLEMMQENTIDTSKIYMLMGDYFIDQFRMAFGVLVNADMASELMAEVGGLNFLYNLVEGGQWTYDEMMTWSEKAYSGEYAAELVMGTIGEQGWVVRSFFATSGLDIFKRDTTTGEAFYVEGKELDPIIDFVEKLDTMENADHYTYNWTQDKRNTNRSNVATTFINNGALFALNQMVLSFEGANVRNMDATAAIVPTPKYFDDGLDSYGALVSDNAGSGGILISSDPDQFTAASAFLQMMTEESDEFFIEYYDNGLKSKNNQIGPKHNRMLDYIHDGICSPMSFLYDNYCAKSLGDTNTYKTYGAMMYDTIDNGVGFSSSWDSQIGAKKSQWVKIKANFGTANAQ